MIILYICIFSSHLTAHRFLTEKSLEGVRQCSTWGAFDWLSNLTIENIMVFGSNSRIGYLLLLLLLLPSYLDETTSLEPHPSCSVWFDWHGMIKTLNPMTLNPKEHTWISCIKSFGLDHPQGLNFGWTMLVSIKYLEDYKNTWAPHSCEWNFVWWWWFEFLQIKFHSYENIEWHCM